LCIIYIYIYLKHILSYDYNMNYKINTKYLCNASQYITNIFALFVLFVANINLNVSFQISSFIYYRFVVEYYTITVCVLNANKKSGNSLSFWLYQLLGCFNISSFFIYLIIIVINLTHILHFYWILFTRTYYNSYRITIIWYI